MLEILCFVTDPMVHKPLLPTNYLFCAAVEGGANGFFWPLSDSPAGLRVHLKKGLRTCHIRPFPNLLSV